MLYGFDEYELDANAPELRRNGEPVKADLVALRLLSVLVRNAGQVIAKRELIAQVWDGRAVSDKVVSVAMVRLRRSLGQRRGEREFVTNVHGRGYRFARPVHARDAAPAPSPAAASSVQSGPPYVGRSRVLDRLRELLRLAQSERGGACMLSGEPGIGKTRALEMFEREARAAAVPVAWGYCREAGDTPPLSPWLQLARAVLQAAAANGAARNDPRFAAARAELGLVLPELFDERDPPVEPAPRPEPLDRAGAAKHRVFAALAQLFALAAERTGYVLVLDDLHRADTASLELLRYWIDELARTRVLLLGTLRDHWEGQDASARAQLAHVLGHRNCERIALARLGEDDVRTYVAALLDDPQGALGRAVFEKSEGNPFFMIELARQLSSAERPDARLLAVPGAALELVRQRVAVLDAATRGVLSCAAVIGRTFELAVLQAATDLAAAPSGADEPAALMASLDRAIASEVVHVASGSRTRFVFGHDLWRAALYDALPAAARRRLHLRVGRALEQRQLAGESVAPADLAYHFYSALPETDLRKTVKHCMDAAWTAAVVYANADVIRHILRALETLDAMPDASPRLRMTLMLRRVQVARIDMPPEYEPMVRDVIAFARKVRSGEALAYAAMLSDADPGFPTFLPSQSVIDDALALLPDEQTDLRASMLGRLARHAPAAFDVAESDRLLARGFELLDGASPGSGSSVARYNLLAAQLYLRGGPAHAAEAAECLREIERRSSDVVTMTIPPVLLEQHRAITALQRGEMPAMQAALESFAARARRIHHRELTFHAERSRLLARVNAGDLARIRGELDALHRRTAAEGLLGTALLRAFDRVVVLGERDRWPDDVAALDPEDTPNVWSIRLRVLVAARQLEQARTLLGRVPPDRLERLPCDRDYLGTLGALARSVIALDAREYFDPLSRLLEPYPKLFSVNVSMYCEGPVALVLGLLALASGRPREAAAQLEAGIALAQRAGLAPSADEALRALARCRG